MQPFQRQTTIVNPQGLHARPAARIARLAAAATARVWIENGTRVADAASIIDLMSLGVGQGTTLTVRIEDQADDDILHAVAELIERGFDEGTHD
jgi:phosphocarrier protein HPr